MKRLLTLFIALSLFACSSEKKSNGAVDMGAPPQGPGDAFNQQNQDKQGPQVGGGGDVVLASKEDVRRTIYSTRDLLKYLNLYEVVVNANQFQFSHVDRDAYHLLGHILDPRNRPYPPDWSDEYWDPISNQVAYEIEDIPLNIKEEGPCPSENQDHAEASVYPQNENGTICFSLEELAKTPLSSLGPEILGLWMHEITHMRGFDEQDADRIQDLFIVGYSFLAPNYFNQTSQIFRSFLGPMQPNDGQSVYVWWNATDDQRLEAVEASGAMQSKLTDLYNLLDEYESIKMCQSRPDGDKLWIKHKFSEFSRGLSESRRDFLHNQLFSAKELLFRNYFYYHNYYLTGFLMCSFDEAKLCSNVEDRYYYNWMKIAYINEEFQNMLAYIWKAHRIQKTHLNEPLDLEDGYTIEKLREVYFNIFRAEILYNKVIADLDEFKKIAESQLNDCNESDILEADRLGNRELADTIEQVKNELTAAYINPIKRYLPEAHRQWFSFLDGISEFDHVINKKIEDAISMHSEALFKSGIELTLKAKWEEEQVSYRDAFLGLENLKLNPFYRYSHMSDHQACMNHDQPEIYDECMMRYEREMICKGIEDPVARQDCLNFAH